MKSTAMLVVTVGVWQIFLAFPAKPSFAGTKVTVGRAVPANEQVSMDQVSHAPWNSLLGRYVDDAGFVNYTAWKASVSDAKLLDQYLDALSLASTTARSTREAQLAFWINAYNAVTVKGILREYPTTSIRNHTAKLVGYNIWEDLLLVVGGKTFSLSQIEHKVLRPMGDPRIHFAIVCASRGCPRLLNEAYASATLEDQLSRNAQDFFAKTANFQYDSRGRTIKVSAIMEWFAKDFGEDTTQQLKRIERFLPDQAAKNLVASGTARVSYLDYDWSLNDQATQRTARGR
ncbi:MAG: DUF547 domain-containing protein [Planctomycetia bacterium]|nr:DUF547 domain-containing protein [Planctomycetia bacterium]